MTAQDCRSCRNGETRFSGLAICPGVAVGRVCLFNERRHVNLPLHKVRGEDKARETGRLEEAVAAVTTQLGALVRDVAKRVGPAEAEIFKVQQMILRDARIQEEMVEAIETEGVNAEMAASRTLDLYETRIGQVDTQYIRERATDLGEIRRRLLGVLGALHPSFECAGQEHCRHGRNRIVVAEELTPSLTVELEANHTIGFVTERGGPTSHAAILARALGIPAVSGIDGIYRRISCGTEVLISGDTGELVLWPEKRTLGRCSVRNHHAKRFLAAVEPVPGLQVMANRASARAPVRVLYPMIVDIEQFLAVKEMFLESIADPHVENLEHGVLFEVPSACLEARRILEVADFGSIGTNDLVQYLFAVDRNNELVASGYDPNRPVLWSLIGHVVRAASETGRFLSVCGEAAGDPGLLGAFMDAGIQSVSVSPRLIPALRQAARARGAAAAQP